MNESKVLLNKLLGPRDPAQARCIGFSASDIEKLLTCGPVSLNRYTQFITFLSVMGLEDGGLLDSDTLLHFHPRQSFMEVNNLSEFLFEELSDNHSIPQAGIYLLEICDAEYFYFDCEHNNQHVYIYNKASKSVRDSGWDFFTYLDKRCAADKSRFHPTKRCTRYREVVPEQLLAIKNAPTEKQVSDFLNLMNHTQVFPGIARLKGYSMQEIAKIEALYNIEAKGELLLFLYTMGINQGGALPPIPAIHNSMSSHLHAMKELREWLEEYDRPDLAEAVFAFDFDEELDCFLFYTQHDEGVYYINSNADELYKEFDSISDMLGKRAKSIEKHGIKYPAENSDCIRLFHFEAGALG
ncbi:hypothetical protein CWC22_004015 [Pseudoalteromonas rubra]|uniref:Knr4/Smi1-like domain-containing protein n=1 Tax=Pseudoalteromonas rubra TaxID=43658 RepID=A0A5S3UQ82_9GAMM|nr:hypothetical protein [Pseudoalteromonas rubra]QPB82219.1 hypothetical protein CWC22_004015 [Pseudoalteromonas rubra]